MEARSWGATWQQGHTLCRNKETKRDDFVFFTNRLACLAMEYALSLLPFEVTSS